MRYAVLTLACVLTVTRASADPCDDLCRPPELDRQLRDELLTGFAVMAAGQLMGGIAQLRVDHGSAERLIAPIPVIGTLRDSVRSGLQTEVRAVLVFSAAVQLMGALIVATAWSTRGEEEQRRVGVTAQGMELHF